MYEQFSAFGAELLQRLPDDTQSRLILAVSIGALCLLAVVFAIARRRARARAHQPVTFANLSSRNTGDEAKPELRFAVKPARRGAPAKRLVLFIHGFMGSELSTWGRFPQLLLEDEAIAKDYDVACFGYKTGILSLAKVPPLEDVAKYLDLELETKYANNYKEIVLFAHSMGGLVARRYIADALVRAAGGKARRVSRVLFFATPHRGSLLATVAGVARQTALKLASLFGSAAHSAVSMAAAAGQMSQLEALAAGSNFLFQLERDEDQLKAREQIQLTYVIAESDLAVDRTSGVGSLDYHIVPGTDHSSLVKPDTADHLAVKVARHFLIETAERTPYAADAVLKQPVLKLPRPGDNAAGTDPHKRFIFWNQSIPFIGRQADLAIIEGFLAAHENPFRWMVLAGEGGMGKSRLALEVCQSAATHWWNAGFADPSKETIDWRVWQPRIPTLIVVDYAGRLAPKVGVMLAGLADRDEAHRLRHPVRVLVLERNPTGPWLETILKSSDRVDDNCTHHDTLTLGRLDDIWPLFEAVSGASKLGREVTLEALAAIDSEQRPLFAYLMADAIARGENVRGWDSNALLKTVLRRDAKSYWNGPVPERPGTFTPATDAEKRALALATMAEGIASGVLDGSHGDLLPTWHLDRHPHLYAAMTGIPAMHGVPPLQPDIVGEFFVAYMLKDLGQARQPLLDLAWQLRPDHMWWFVSRLGQDFPGDIASTGVMRCNLASKQSRSHWCMAAVNLTAGDREAARAVYDDLLALAQSNPQDHGIHCAMAASNLMIDYGNARELFAARVYYDDIVGLALIHDCEEIRMRQAEAASHLISCYGNASAARLVHNDAFAYTREPGLQRRKVAYDKLSDDDGDGSAWTPDDDLSASEPARRTKITLKLSKPQRSTRDLVVAKIGHGELAQVSFGDQMAQLAKVGSDLGGDSNLLAARAPSQAGTDIRVQRADTAVNLANARSQTDDLRAARALYEEVVLIARNYDTLRHYQAVAGINLITVYVHANQLTSAQNLFQELIALARASNDSEIRRLVAESARFLIAACGSANKLGAARAVYDEIATAARDHPKDMVLQQAWACTLGVLLWARLASTSADEATKGIAVPPPPDIAAAGTAASFRITGNSPQAERLLEEKCGGDPQMRTWLTFLSTPGAQAPPEMQAQVAAR